MYIHVKRKPLVRVYNWSLICWCHVSSSFIHSPSGELGCKDSGFRNHNVLRGTLYQRLAPRCHVYTFVTNNVYLLSHRHSKSSSLFCFKIDLYWQRSWSLCTHFEFSSNQRTWSKVWLHMRNNYFYLLWLNCTYAPYLNKNPLVRCSSLKITDSIYDWWESVIILFVILSF